MKALRKLGFDIGYLALLTQKDVKPLSRWESPLDEAGLDALHNMGLRVRQIHRKVRRGHAIIETVFSSLPAYTELFERVARRRGRQVAIIAVARRMLEDAFTMLRKDEAFRFVPATTCAGTTACDPQVASSVAG